MKHTLEFTSETAAVALQFALEQVTEHPQGTLIALGLALLMAGKASLFVLRTGARSVAFLGLLGVAALPFTEYGEGARIPAWGSLAAGALIGTGLGALRKGQGAARTPSL